MHPAWHLPRSFPYSVRDTSDLNLVKVSTGKLRDGKTVDVQPFTRENLDAVATMIAQLRFGPEPAVDYITNQFVDIHRSSGRSHVVGQILTEPETLGQQFKLGVAAAEAQVNKMGNCDRVNALGYRRLQPVFGRRHPVLYHWTVANNHNTVLVGDPRMRKYGERNTVVADGHTVFPMPHTLDQAAYRVQIPAEGEEHHEDLENSWLACDDEMGTSVLPEAISDQRQQQWLKDKRWPKAFGAAVVRKWHASEIRETGAAPDRWQYLFSCKDPSTSYRTPGGGVKSYNRLPLEYVQERNRAFLQIHGEFPQMSSSGNSSGEDSDDMAGGGASGAKRWRVRADIVGDVALEPVTPFTTHVRDVATGRKLAEMYAPGFQGPAPAINQSFPIKNPASPNEVHPDYACDDDAIYCNAHVAIDGLELPEETKDILRDHFPQESRQPGYFALRIAEIRAEYECPIDRRPPPSSTRWQAVRLTHAHRNVAPALKGQYGVVPVDYGNQNVGGMGPAFAGAVIGNRQQKRTYLSRVSEQFDGDLDAANQQFDNYAIQVGTGSRARQIAPWGGGNVAQFLNGNANTDEPAHFISVEIIVHIKDKKGVRRSELMPHLFQIREVPLGEQALLEYGKAYCAARPGIEMDGSAGVVKSEPVEHDVLMADATASGPAAEHAPTDVNHTDGGRPRPLSQATGPLPLVRRPETSSAASSFIVARTLDALQQQFMEQDSRLAIDTALAQFRISWTSLDEAQQDAVWRAARDVPRGASSHRARQEQIQATLLNIQMARRLEELRLLRQTGEMAIDPAQLAQGADRPVTFHDGVTIEAPEDTEDEESLFYRERQQQWSCAQHAANAMIGGPRLLMRHFAAYEAGLSDRQDAIEATMRATGVFAETVCAVLQQAGIATHTFDYVPPVDPGNEQARLAQFTVLDELDTDRLLLQSYITLETEDRRHVGASHYVAFRRVGQEWVLLDSRGEQQDGISPSNYLLTRGATHFTAIWPRNRLVGIQPTAAGASPHHVAARKRHALHSSDEIGVRFDVRHQRWKVEVKGPDGTVQRASVLISKYNGNITDAREAAEAITQQIRNGTYKVPPRRAPPAHTSTRNGVSWRNSTRRWGVGLRGPNGHQTVYVPISKYNGDVDKAREAAEAIAEQISNGTYKDRVRAVPPLTPAPKKG
jgi:hypothetical protein